MSRLFRTTQRNVVLPTRELIKTKGTDFRILSIISILSNVDNNTISGKNCRYTSNGKVNKNMKQICETLGMNTGQVARALRNLLKHESDEFRMVEKNIGGEVQYCYEINYDKGGFVKIPYNKLEKVLIGLGNNCIKLYCNLLWLCIEDGALTEKQLTQSYLLELMGLSKSSAKILKVATDTLVEVGLIKIRREWMVETKIIKGLPVSTTPKELLYYSIVVEED